MCLRPCGKKWYAGCTVISAQDTQVSRERSGQQVLVENLEERHLEQILWGNLEERHWKLRQRLFGVCTNSDIITTAQKPPITTPYTTMTLVPHSTRFHHQPPQLTGPQSYAHYYWPFFLRLRTATLLSWLNYPQLLKTSKYYARNYSGLLDDTTSDRGVQFTSRV